MTPATAAPKLERKQRPERARFVAPLAKNGAPLKITLQRQKEVFDSETGRKQADPSTGHYIHFNDDGNRQQSFETDDPKLIDELRIRANTHGTYVEVPIQKPPAGDVLRQIIGLMAQRDADGLVALYREEEETHQRDEVFEAIEEAVEALS